MYILRILNIIFILLVLFTSNLFAFETSFSEDSYYNEVINFEVIDKPTGVIDSNLSIFNDSNTLVYFYNDSLGEFKNVELTFDFLSGSFVNVLYTYETNTNSLDYNYTIYFTNYNILFNFDFVLEETRLTTDFADVIVNFENEDLIEDKYFSCKLNIINNTDDFNKLFTITSFPYTLEDFPTGSYKAIFNLDLENHSFKVSKLLDVYSKDYYELYEEEEFSSYLKEIEDQEAIKNKRSVDSNKIEEHIQGVSKEDHFSFLNNNFLKKYLFHMLVILFVFILFLLFVFNKNKPTKAYTSRSKLKIKSNLKNSKLKSIKLLFLFFVTIIFTSSLYALDFPEGLEITSSEFEEMYIEPELINIYLTPNKLENTTSIIYKPELGCKIEPSINGVYGRINIINEDVYLLNLNKINKFFFGNNYKTIKTIINKYSSEPLQTILNKTNLEKVEFISKIPSNELDFIVDSKIKSVFEYYLNNKLDNRSDFVKRTYASLNSNFDESIIKYMIKNNFLTKVPLLLTFEFMPNKSLTYNPNSNSTYTYGFYISNCFIESNNKDLSVALNFRDKGVIASVSDSEKNDDISFIAKEKGWDTLFLEKENLNYKEVSKINLELEPNFYFSILNKTYNLPSSLKSKLSNVDFKNSLKKDIFNFNKEYSFKSENDLDVFIKAKYNNENIIFNVKANSINEYSAFWSKNKFRFNSDLIDIKDIDSQNFKVIFKKQKSISFVVSKTQGKIYDSQDYKLKVDVLKARPDVDVANFEFSLISKALVSQDYFYKRAVNNKDLKLEILESKAEYLSLLINNTKQIVNKSTNYLSFENKDKTEIVEFSYLFNNYTKSNLILKKLNLNSDSKNNIVINKLNVKTNINLNNLYNSNTSISSSNKNNNSENINFNYYDSSQNLLGFSINGVDFEYNLENNKCVNPFFEDDILYLFNISNFKISDFDFDLDYIDLSNINNKSISGKLYLDDYTSQSIKLNDNISFNLAINNSYDKLVLKLNTTDYLNKLFYENEYPVNLFDNFKLETENDFIKCDFKRINNFEITYRNIVQNITESFTDFDNLDAQGNAQVYLGSSKNTSDFRYLDFIINDSGTFRNYGLSMVERKLPYYNYTCNFKDLNDKVKKSKQILNLNQKDKLFNINNFYIDLTKYSDSFITSEKNIVFDIVSKYSDLFIYKIDETKSSRTIYRDDYILDIKPKINSFNITFDLVYPNISKIDSRNNSVFNNYEKQIKDFFKNKDYRYLLIANNKNTIPSKIHFVDASNLTNISYYAADYYYINTYLENSEFLFKEEPIYVGRLPFNNKNDVVEYFENLPTSIGNNIGFVYTPDSTGLINTDYLFYNLDNFNIFPEIYNDTDIKSNYFNDYKNKYFNSEPNSDFKVYVTYKNKVYLDAFRNNDLVFFNTHGAYNSFSTNKKEDYFNFNIQNNNKNVPDDLFNMYEYYNDNRVGIISDSCNTSEKLGEVFLREGSSFYLGANNLLYALLRSEPLLLKNQSVGEFNSKKIEFSNKFIVENTSVKRHPYLLLGDPSIILKQNLNSDDLGFDIDFDEKINITLDSLNLNQTVIFAKSINDKTPIQDISIKSLVVPLNLSKEESKFIFDGRDYINKLKRNDFYIKVAYLKNIYSNKFNFYLLNGRLYFTISDMSLVYDLDVDLPNNFNFNNYLYDNINYNTYINNKFYPKSDHKDSIIINSIGYGDKGFYIRRNLYVNPNLLDLVLNNKLKLEILPK